MPGKYYHLPSVRCIHEGRVVAKYDGSSLTPTERLELTFILSNLDRQADGYHPDYRMDRSIVRIRRLGDPPVEH